LENDKSVGVGRILLPAIALHGSYDFSIMLLNFLASGDGDNVSIVYSIVALLASVFFVVVGVWYYVKQSHQQIQRLDQIDKARSFVGIQA